jgi:hypothetical protein
MALVDLYLDVKTGTFVKSILDASPFNLPDRYQEDSLEINLWLYSRDYTVYTGNLFTILPLSGYDCFVSVGDAGTVMASQATFTKVNNNQTFSGVLDLNTTLINTALSAANPTAKTFEVRVLKSGTIYHRVQKPLNIYKSVALAAAVTTPATSAALSKTEAAATYLPYELPAGRGIVLTSEDGTQKGMIYMHNDGSVRLPGIT